MQRLDLQINGTVQGIGFRPLVYRIARQLNLTGWVLNNGAGVQIQIQGDHTDKFKDLLKKNISSLAEIELFLSKNIPLELDELAFTIKPSQNSQNQTEFVPDLSICEACVDELFDSQSRFYLYPFINCTQCGARYSITRQLPYDRPQTTMQDFVMCQTCETEYTDPLNRRYHAEPIACGNCGPSYAISLAVAAKSIQDNQIIAIKAIGGYQLIANALSLAVTDELRRKKQRPFKPFAVMLVNLASVHYYYHCSAAEAKLLESKEKPIVLLKIKKEFNALIAPGLTEHGVMLPYTGMHYCLFYYLLGQFGQEFNQEKKFPHPLIVTSGNSNGQALISENISAEQHLTKITPHIISHNRDILLAVDDSIVKIIAKQPAIMRRARGFVPKKIVCNNLRSGILALGCHLKNTVCLTKSSAAYVSQYLGTLQNKSNIDFLHLIITHLQQLFNIQVQTIAHDLHPDIYTSQLAASLDLPYFAVQHHHAHIASVMAEFQIDEPVLGWVLDGFGYANSTEAWGGELLLVDGAEFQRIAQLKSYPLLGGDKVAKQPWRMAVSILQDLNLPDAIHRFGNNAATAAQLLNFNGAVMQTSSCGRYFDAASALLDVCQENSYEGEAAMRLEALVTTPLILKNSWELQNNTVDFSSLWRYILTADSVTGANYFHGTLAAGLVEMARKKCKELKINKLILSGGCLQNKILAESMIFQLQKYGIEVYYPRQLPCNDGGLSLGQAWVVNKLL